MVLSASFFNSTWKPFAFTLICMILSARYTYYISVLCRYMYGTATESLKPCLFTELFIYSLKYFIKCIYISKKSNHKRILLLIISLVMDRDYPPS